RQRTDSPRDSSPALIVNESYVLQWHAVHRIKFARFVALRLLKESCQRDQAAAFSFPQLANCKVRGDAIDVGRKRIARLVAISRLIDAHESLLSHVNRAVVVVQHTIDVARNLVAVAPDQLRERGLIARLRGL